MKVVNHLLEGVKVVRSPNVSGFMEPTGAIMHYTAGYTAESAINTLCNKAVKASAHLVIDDDGEITQLVPFNRVAWHAGPSKLDGLANCNNFCIGFEFVNPGFFRLKNGVIMDSAGKAPVPKKTLDRYDLSLRAANPRIGGGEFIWPAYTEPQIEAGLAAFNAIRAAYKISHLAGHEDIDTRKWKTDPGPAFPMGLFKSALFGGVDRSNGMQSVSSRFLVNTAKLNVRSAPRADSQIITTLSGGSEVIVLEDLGPFSLVEFAPGRKGYVADQYIVKGR